MHRFAAVAGGLCGHERGFTGAHDAAKDRAHDVGALGEGACRGRKGRRFRILPSSWWHWISVDRRRRLRWVTATSIRRHTPLGQCRA